MSRTPRLAAHLQHLRQAAEQLPEIAAASMEKSAQDGLRQSRDPYGRPLAATKPAGKLAAGAKFDEQVGRYRVRGRFTSSALGGSHAFDPAGHVRAGWRGVVVAGEAILLGTHRACGWLGRAWRGRPARLQRPQEGQGLGVWLQPLTKSVASALRPGGRRV